MVCNDTRCLQLGFTLQGKKPNINIPKRRFDIKPSSNEEVNHPVVLIFHVACLYAQNQAKEAEIGKLEQMQVKAVLSRDTTSLLKLWYKNFIVNSPENVIVLAGKTATFYHT